MAQFFYDKQIRRFLNQFIRIFSDIYVEFGQDVNGNQVLYRVPCRYADTNRQASAILKQNSDNGINSVPMIVCYITRVDYDRSRVQEPKFVDNRSVRPRAIDPHTGNVSTQQGHNFQLQRLMPAPYKLTIVMELWTSNFDQKMQLWEQIAAQFNPDMEIQNSDNYYDWSSLSYILLTDTNWTTRNIPVGSDDPIDVGTFTFEVPIWITTPAKLLRLGIVQSVAVNTYDAMGNAIQTIQDQVNQLGNRQYFTPTGYQILVNNGNVSLFPSHGPTLNNTAFSTPTTIGNAIPWFPVVSSFGVLSNNYSMLYLTDSQTQSLITGTVAYDATNPNNLLFTVDPATIPTNVLSSINAVINPQVNGPGIGLPAASSGQRYLLTNNLGGASLGNGAAAWQNADTSIITAFANDIIQYTGSAWHVAYRPNAVSNSSYVTNTFSNIQYAWNGTAWQKSWQGIYQEGLWSIVL